MHFTFALALMAAAQPADATPETSLVAPPPGSIELAPLPLEQQSALRCAVAVAVVDGLQKQGDENGTRYAAMGTRGQEFFVRSLAQVMDEADLSRTTLRLHVAEEVRRFEDREQLHAVMPGCQLLLDASGL